MTLRCILAVLISICLSANAWAQDNTKEDVQPKDTTETSPAIVKPKVDPKTRLRQERQAQQAARRRVYQVKSTIAQVTKKQRQEAQKKAQEQYQLKQLKRRFGLEQRKTKRSQPQGLFIDYYIPNDNSPQMDRNKSITCVWRRPQKNSTVDGNNMRIQCDAKTKVCLVAEDLIFKEAPNRQGGQPKLVPTNRTPDNLRYCRYGNMGDYARLKAMGYTFKAAKLDAPYGFKRDRFGRSLQTHFDLRSRLLLGVYYAGVGEGSDYQNTLSVETKSTYEHWNTYKQRRYRYRFIEGQLTMAPFMARATVFEFDYGRQGDDPLFFIGNMIGTPSRHDVHINLGTGLTLGRLDYQTINGEGVAFIDFIEGRINWELLQGLALEDYLMVRLGGGIGTRRYSDADTGPVYLYPEVGIKSAWLIGARGLGQISADAKYRYGYEPDTEATWHAAHANISAEWIAITISDQPLSLFVQPEYNYLDLRDGQNSVKRQDYRIMAGLRLSMFVPPPTDPKKLRAKGSK